VRYLGNEAARRLPTTWVSPAEAGRQIVYDSESSPQGLRCRTNLH